MENPEKFTMTDGSPYNGMLKRGHSVFKAKSHRGTTITFQEIDLEEYDKRVDHLARTLAASPEVDLLAVLKDALYDLPLDYLAEVEKKLGLELQKPKPEIATKVDTTYRGTCVNLNIGGKNLVELRH